MTADQSDAVEREILRSLWKAQILHQAQDRSIIGNGMLEELRERGYRVSPGRLYPVLGRMEKLGWLASPPAGRARPLKGARPYRATPAGRRALRTVRTQLRELLSEINAMRKD